MKVTFAPEGGSPQVWDYVPSKVKQSEAEMLERKAGSSYDEFNKNVLGGYAKARKVLLWHCFRKDHLLYRWEDLPDFAMAEVTVEFDAAELADIRAAVAGAKIDDSEKAEALAMIDSQMATLPEPDPKVRENSSDNDGGAG